MDCSKSHNRNSLLDLEVFDQEKLIQAFENANSISTRYDTINIIDTSDNRVFHTAVKWYKFKQTDICKREIIIPSAIVILILGTITSFYYYSLCTDKSWQHIAEMVLPAFFALLIGIFGTLGCIRGYAYADYHFAKQKIS